MPADYEQSASLFRALSHPTRLQILDMLRGGEVCVCHMETALGKRQAYISQQLMILRETGLVTIRKDGLQVFYRLVDGPTTHLLAVALGPADASGPHVLDNCPCPRCEVTVSEDDLSLRR